MFVTTVIQIAQIAGEAAQKPELLDAQVGTGKGIPPAFGVGRLDQTLQNVQCRCLDPVAQQKLLTAWETLHGRDQPGEKTKVRLQRRAGFSRAVNAADTSSSGLIAQDLLSVPNPMQNRPWTPQEIKT